MTNDKIDGKVLETFMTRAQQAAKMGSKEIRVPMPDAMELVAVIGQIMARNITLSEQTREMEKLIGSSLRMDGGKFG